MNFNTIMKRLEVDEARMRAYNNFLIDNGFCCLVPTANNGECPNLSYEERKRVWKITLEVARPRHTSVFPCITTNNTRDCIELAKYAESKGKIRSIKDSTDNTQRVHEILNLCGDKVAVVVAGGGTALESLLLGPKPG